MWKVIREDELYHHGVKGQKWGVRHGPPYPLKSGGSNQQKKTIAGNRTVDERISKSLYEGDGGNPKRFARTISKNISDVAKRDLSNSLNAIRKHYRKWESSGDDDSTGYSDAVKASREDEATYRKQLEQEARRLLGQYADKSAPKSGYLDAKVAKGYKAYEAMADYIDFLVVTNSME